MHYTMKQGIYILLIHYDLNTIIHNGQDIDIAHDNSGVQVYFTDIPTTKEIGLIQLEAGEFVIPPKQSDYKISMAMHSTCTDALLPVEGIKILYIGGHMHYLGTKIRLDRIRNGNIKTIFEIKQWDFDRQFAYPVYYTLKQNDTLRLSCIYDSHDRENNRGTIM